MANLTSHLFSCVTGSLCMSNVHLSRVFQETSLLLHYVMEQSVKKYIKNKARDTACHEIG